LLKPPSATGNSAGQKAVIVLDASLPMVADALTSVSVLSVVAAVARHVMIASASFR
jgi:hypothetical protein